MTELKPSDVIPSIIAAAVAAAGPMGNNEGQWRAKVNRAIPHITSMLNERSRQWMTAVEVLEAHVFTGQYARHEVEESSTRVMLYVDVGRPSDNFPDGIETIRSHRTDNAAGRDMLARIEQLEPGDELVCWRAMESIEGTNKSVRTLVHLETRPKRTQTPSGGHAPPSTAREQQPPPLAAAPDPRPDLTDSINSERLQTWRAGAREALTNFEFDQLVEHLAGGGYDFGGVSEVEWDSVVRPFIRKIINERK